MSITELVQSPKYKKFMGYVYGWGAAVVLLGALFKIQHYPHSGTLLLVGMLTEVAIFFFSAFEPPHEDPDWSIVYPELIGLEPKAKPTTGGGGGSNLDIEGIEKLQELLEKISIEPNKLSHLSDGLEKLATAANSLSNLNDAAEATNGYISSMNTAAGSVQQLNDSSKALSESYTDVSAALSKSGQVIVEGAKASVDELNAKVSGVVAEVSNSGSDLSKKLKDSTDVLANSYQNLNNSVKNNAEEVNAQSEAFQKSMSKVNSSLSSVSAMYELQLKNSNEYMNNSKNAYEGMDNVLNAINSTLENAKVYKAETDKLNQNLASLNTIYGNMLSAMNSKA
ncbi:MAG: gliding motility protein GldL [Marinifilaceae bacterium]|jgi:gliding motility-associated protein GldL|nr:gliding motility protein GldL [Marinifilaceae bacterium]